MVTSLGHFISWVAEMVVFGGIEYVVTVTLHGDALGVAHWMFVQLVPSINYTVFPAVQGGRAVPHGMKIDDMTLHQK